MCMFSSSFLKRRVRIFCTHLCLAAVHFPCDCSLCFPQCPWQEVCSLCHRCTDWLRALDTGTRHCGNRVFLKKPLVPTLFSRKRNRVSVTKTLYDIS
uniref:Secreted protein n=1 Tax=Anguilla anguilla TaxID=7936 RepID=A0A0E9SJ94_ANGAN